MNMRARLLLHIVALVTILVGFSPMAYPAADAPPNIIFILADDLGYGDLGVQGSRAIKTPHIDRLATEGMRFTNCYASAPICSPSRAGLLTGRYPLRSGIMTAMQAARALEIPLTAFLAAAQGLRLKTYRNASGRRRFPARDVEAVAEQIAGANG